MRRSLLVVLAVAGVAFFAGLDRAAISDADEAFYAEAAREMVASGDYLTPRYNYANRPVSIVGTSSAMSLSAPPATFGIIAAARPKHVWEQLENA